jgi:hypothetical protein
MLSEVMEYFRFKIVKEKVAVIKMLLDTPTSRRIALLDISIYFSRAIFTLFALELREPLN